jgi:nucleoside-diphosphate-sugar epimerase
MQVLVTGASGFIGSALTRKLLESGHTVRVLVRDPVKFSTTGLEVDEVIEGDITDPGSMEMAVEGMDVVYAIAGTFREPSLTDERYRAINVNAVSHIVSAASRHGVKRVVHCSTCGIHGSIDGSPADETYPVQPSGIYEVTKAAGEALALEMGKSNGVEVVVLRPTPVYGPGDTRLLKLFKLANKNLTLLFGPGTAGYQLVYIDDLVDAFMLAGTEGKAAGEAFLIGGAEIPSINDLLVTLAKLFEKVDQKILRLPARPIWLAGWLCEIVCRPFNVSPPIYRRRIEFFTNNRAFCIDKARELLGYQPKIATEEGLRRTLAWYRSEGLL